MKFSTRIGKYMDSKGLRSIFFLYYGQHDLPKEPQYSIYCTLKQIATLTRLTVKQIQYRLKVRKWELTNQKCWLTSMKERQQSKRAPEELSLMPALL